MSAANLSVPGGATGVRSGVAMCLLPMLANLVEDRIGHLVLGGPRNSALAVAAHDHDFVGRRPETYVRPRDVIDHNHVDALGSQLLPPVGNRAFPVLCGERHQ